MTWPISTPMLKAMRFGEEAVLVEAERLQLGREAEAVDQAEAADGDAVVDVPAELAEAAEILERLPADGKADHHVDEMRRDAEVEQDAEDQRGGMAEREQRDVEKDVLEAVEKEDHAEQEEQVVVSRHHVLGAEIEEGERVCADGRLHEGGVAAADGVGEDGRRDEAEGEEREEDVVVAHRGSRRAGLLA